MQQEHLKNAVEKEQILEELWTMLKMSSKFRSKFPKSPSILATYCFQSLKVSWEENYFLSQTSSLWRKGHLITFFVCLFNWQEKFKWARSTLKISFDLYRLRSIPASFKLFPSNLNYIHASGRDPSSGLVKLSFQPKVWVRVAIPGDGQKKEHLSWSALPSDKLGAQPLPVICMHSGPFH